MNDATGATQVPEGTVLADSRPGDPSKARRRLILAAGAALPSIYTLSSGAQTAAASNLVCLAKEGPPPIRFTVVPELGLQDNDYARIPDGWVRAPVYFGEYDRTPANCVTSPQSSCVAFTPASSQNSTPLPASGSGVGTNAETGSVWIVQGNRMVSNANTPITNIAMGRKHYGLVYVNQAGTVSTLDPNGRLDLIPVTTSCWASIVGGRISKLG
jgi:hypothetical protein